MFTSNNETTSSFKMIQKTKNFKPKQSIRITKQTAKKVKEATLIQYAMDGNSLAFDELIRRHENRIFKFAIKFTKDEELAREVVQDVLMRMYTKLDSFEGRSSLSTWLYRVTFNSSFMLLRNLKKHDVVDKSEDAHKSVENVLWENTSLWEQSGEQQLERKQMREVIETCLEQLSPRHREILVMRDWDGLANQEIADKLGISLMAAKSCLHRARAFFRDIYNKEWSPALVAI